MSADTTLAPRYAVRCIKADGIRRVEFKRYAELGLAEIDLAGLRRVGIPAEIVELDSAALDSIPAELRETQR